MKRVLSFKVSEQKLEKDPSCSFEDIVSGTKGYLRARFSFNRAWDKCACIAVFRKLLEEYPVVLKDKECEIPEEALDWDSFHFRFVGRRGDGAVFTTNEVEVKQSRGGTFV